MNETFLQSKYSHSVHVLRQIRGIPLQIPYFCIYAQTSHRRYESIYFVIVLPHGIQTRHIHDVSEMFETHV